MLWCYGCILYCFYMICCLCLDVFIVVHFLISFQGLYLVGRLVGVPIQFSRITLCPYRRRAVRRSHLELSALVPHRALRLRGARYEWSSRCSHRWRSFGFSHRSAFPVWTEMNWIGLNWMVAEVYICIPKSARIDTRTQKVTSFMFIQSYICMCFPNINII